MTTCLWPSPAKINLFLYVTGKRSDGYHYIQTLFQFLDYEDILSIKITFNKKIRLINPLNGIKIQNNLIFKAAKLLQSYCWSFNDPNILGADIKIKKILPIGGGLGGGSSNAATVLIALNIQWNCNLNIETLIKIGFTLGADIPIFLKGRSSFGEGIGELLSQVELIEKWYLISIPPIKISTASIFNSTELKIKSPIRSFSELMKIPFYNDCEKIVKKNYPEINKYILLLQKYAPSRITGTGSCIFSEFNSKKNAYEVFHKVKHWINCFVAKGSNISSLHKKLSKFY